MNQISIARSIQEISDCVPVMSELRPHLSRAEFITQVCRQHEECHYQLAYLQADGSIPQSGGYANEAVAGFRLSESLSWGKFLYVDDLVTRSDRRSQGSGGLLFTWLENYARSNGCQQLTLDSGVQRFAAHRFYLHHRMEITSHHFTLKL